MFTDIHNHCIYGVDDGAHRFESTQELLTEAIRDGVHAIISTPHVTPGQERFPQDVYDRHLQKARDWLQSQNMDISIYVGAEILYTPHTASMLQDGRITTMAGTKNVLIEFSPDDKYEQLLEAATAVGNAGYQPIFAHIERYMALTKLDQLYELQEDYNVRLQVNARTLLKKPGLFRKKYLYGMFKEGLIDFVASDTHHMEGRRTCMTQGFEALSALAGKTAAEKLMIENPTRLLTEKYFAHS